MNRFTKLAVTFALILTVLTLCVSADGAYSSQDDPLVSLSYVNDILGPQIMEQVMAKVEADYIKISDIRLALAGSYTPVALQKGQTLMADGCCEVILLDGAAKAVVTSEANVRTGVGLADLTAGVTITNEELLTANHYLVIPKADGRGFAVTSDTANILVRGEYHITG